MEERRRPIVKPTEEIWTYCEQLAEKHEITPFEVLIRLIKVGRFVANIEEEGGETIGIIDGKGLRINVFEKK
jgi:hypothetical protein